jgi:hypothetical protein
LFLLSLLFFFPVLRLCPRASWKLNTTTEPPHPISSCFTLPSHGLLCHWAVKRKPSILMHLEASISFWFGTQIASMAWLCFLVLQGFHHPRTYWL